jgi:sterol desaturase/sphingolipid hydroxylase (fatty acid hydroxylase superfamily)
MDALTSFDHVGAPAAFAIVLALFALEARRPLRARVEPGLRRIARNAVFGAAGGVITRAIVITAMVATARYAHRHGIGVLPLLERSGVPDVVAWPLLLLLLDASMYGWHRLNHQARWLWRFHRVHHVDLDLDVSTALRFHPGELLLSAPFRVAQTFVLGPTPLLALGYELAMQVATAFHHANWRLPLRFERVVQRVLVTPRMHQIHHSVVPEQTASNWSVIFSFWDRIAGSYRNDVDEAQLVIGVPELRAPRAVTLGKLLALPFARSRALRNALA